MAQAVRQQGTARFPSRALKELELALRLLYPHHPVDEFDIR